MRRGSLAHLPPFIVDSVLEGDLLSSSDLSLDFLLSSSDLSLDFLLSSSDLSLDLSVSFTGQTRLACSSDLLSSSDLLDSVAFSSDLLNEACSSDLLVSFSDLWDVEVSSTAVLGMTSELEGATADSWRGCATSSGDLLSLGLTSELLLGKAC